MMNGLYKDWKVEMVAVNTYEGNEHGDLMEFWEIDIRARNTHEVLDHILDLYEKEIFDLEVPGRIHVEVRLWQIKITVLSIPPEDGVLDIRRGRRKEDAQKKARC